MSAHKHRCVAFGAMSPQRRESALYGMASPLWVGPIVGGFIAGGKGTVIAWVTLTVGTFAIMGTVGLLRERTTFFRVAGAVVLLAWYGTVLGGFLAGGYGRNIAWSVLVPPLAVVAIVANAAEKKKHPQRVVTRRRRRFFFLWWH